MSLNSSLNQNAQQTGRYPAQYLGQCNADTAYFFFLPALGPGNLYLP